jgi:hypothetical protein
VAGFALTAYPIAVERGYLTRAEAVRRALTTLRFFHDGQQGTGPDAIGYKGFYYHFLDMKTGRRVWKSEISTIDSTYLFAGAIAAAMYFDRDTKGEVELRRLADPHDRAFRDRLADLGELIVELGAAAARLRDTASGLLTASEESTRHARLDLSEVVSQSVAQHRDYLERHGVKLVERLESESFSFGNRSALTRMIQQLLAYAAEDGAPQSGRFVWVRVWNDADSVVGRMNRLLETEMMLGRFITPSEIRDRLQRLTVDSVRRFADQHLRRENALLVLGGDIDETHVKG